MAEEWNAFLSDLKQKDIVKYSAINCFTLKKVSEDTVEVRYPSEASKLEFDKISTDFLNHFRHKVHNFKISFSYKVDIAVKKEVMTKRKKFEQLAAVNPLLYELNELLNFDLS